MNLITCKKFKGGGKVVSYLLAAVFAFAFGALQMVQAATTQSFLFYGQSGTSQWSDKNSWKYNNGSKSGSWTTPSGVPDGFSYDVYFRSGMAAPNNKKTQSYNSSWDHVVTFSGAQKVGATQQPLHLDAGSSAENPIVFTATQSGYGLTSSSTLNIAETADGYLQINSGTYSFGYIILCNGSGKTGVLTMNGGTMKILNNYTRIGCGGGTGILTVKTGAVFDNSEASGNGKNMTLGQSDGSTGILNVEGGDVTIAGNLNVNYNAGSKNSAMNITDGGVLTVGNITFGGTVANTVTIDNGTIKAHNDHANFIPSNSILTFTVGAGGGTIDNNGYSITIGAAIGGTGGMTFKGTGTTTLNGTPSYTGGTTVEAGTVLSLATAAKSAIVTNPVSVEIPASGAAEGTVVFEVTGGGTFTQAEVDKMVVTGTDASRYALVLADGGAKVAVSDTLAGEYVWNDGSSGAGWHTSGKWSKNNVAGNWYDSTAAVFANAGDAVTVDADVTAASVTFRADATVDGTDTLKVPVVDVASSVAATISAPTADPLEKIGAGTLTLGAPRTDATTLSDGTLVMSGTGTTLDWSKFTFGTDVSKPVTLKFENGATVANASEMRFGAVAGMTNTVYKECGDWTVSDNFLMGLSDGTAQTFYHNGGTLTVGRYFSVGDFNGDAGVSHMEINGGRVNTTRAGNHTLIGSQSDGTVIVRNGGTLNATGNLLVGNNAAGTMTIDNGGVVNVADIIFAYNETGRDSLVELKTGGELSVNSIYYRNGTIAADTFLFNGGTLKCKSSELITAHDRLFVKVASNGGIIDLDGRTVAIDEPLLEDAESTGGGMAFIGGGSVTLASGNTYTGTTTVEVGTTVHVAALDEIGGGLAVTVPESAPADGVYTLLTISGEESLEEFSLPDAPEKCSLRLSSDKKSLLCIYGYPQNTWIGGASGNLSDRTGWSLGFVPTSGDSCVIGNAAAPASLELGDTFAPSAITFPSGSAAVTIDGRDLTGIAAITNNSSSMVEFKDAVVFSGDVDVVQNSGAVKFTGGVMGVKLARATDIHGTYNFTETGDLIECPNTTVKSDGVYNLLNGTFHKHNGDFHVEAGGKVVVKNAKINSTAQNGAHLLGTFNGLFVVTNQFLVQGNSTHYLNTDGSGTLVVNELRVIQNGKIVPGAKTIMGPDGIVRGAGYVRVQNSGSHEFGSYADWTMYHDPKGTNTATESPVFYKHSSSSTWSYLTFDTTDYNDNTIGRTITCEAPISAADEASAAKFRVTVKGKGKFVFANTSDGNIFSGGLIVQDTATVEVKANAKPGKGAITLGAGTTLALTAESREFTPLANTLNLPTEGTATLRIDGKRLRHGEHVIASVVTGESENVKLDGKSSALAGRKATLRVEGGKLYLTIKPDGTMIIVR